jgi:hypothetical protein
MPFERAAQMMECLLGVQISEATTRRQAEQAGELAEAVQTAQVQAHTEEVKAGTTPARLAVSAHGAYIPLLKGEWAEVRTVAIGEVESAEMAQGESNIQVQQLSTFRT